MFTLAQFQPILVPLLSVLCILLLAIVLAMYRMKSFYLKKADLISQLLSSFQPEKDLEKNLSDLLGIVVSLVNTEGYYFYLPAPAKNNLVLKAVRFNEKVDVTVGPDYSGLVPYQKELFCPPLSMEPSLGKPVIIKEGKVPLLVIPVKGGMGQIVAGPVRQIPRSVMELLAFLGEKLQPAVETIIAVDKMHNQVEKITTSTKAIRSLTKSALDLDGSLATLMGLSIKMIQATGGSFLISTQNHLETAVISGLQKDTTEIFQNDQKTHSLLYQAIKDKDYVYLNNENGSFQIPTYLTTQGVQSLLGFNITNQAFQGVAVFWYLTQPEVEQYRLAALQMITRRMGDALNRQAEYKKISSSYLELLKTLVSTFDSLETYSVGHSKLVSMLSGVLASELKLPPAEIRKIMLAGFLHDVGMLGLSGEVLFKEGIYNDIEYSTMQLHAEVGAAMIESIIGDSTVASYIRHHHERWDGCGYPGGYSGEDIPLGARIIAVADTFNAKTSGRKHRKASSYGKAIADLQAAAGSQLDPTLVDVLLGWFAKKQQASEVAGKALGPCWEMQCCPENIVQQCPAYLNKGQNCWETENVSCAAHGTSCESCIVFTEFLYRAKCSANKEKAV